MNIVSCINETKTISLSICNYAFKDFIIQDDQKITIKILYGINDFNERDKVINIVSFKVSIAT